MSRLGNALWGGGVFAVVFVGAWLVLTYMDLAENHGIEMVQAGGPKQQALGVFAEARMRASGAKVIQPGDERYKEVELQMLRELASSEGVLVTDSMIAQARTDAPTTPGQVKFAELPGKEGGRLICASMRIQGQVTHYATTYLPDEIRDPQQAMLPEYILSGCADAIRYRSRIVTPAQYAKAVIPSLPADKRYAAIRKDFEDLANGR